MIGPKYEINAWGKYGTFLEIMFWVYVVCLLWIMKDESIEFIKQIWETIK